MSVSYLACVALHQETYGLQAVALLNRVARSSSVHDSKMEYNLNANLHASCWLFGYALFASSSVTIESPIVDDWIISSDFGVDMRKRAVNFTFHSRVLALVSFEHDGTANSSCVRRRGDTASAADQLRPRIVLLLHDFRVVLGVHLVHLDHAMLPHFHSNRHCPRVPESLDVHSSATMQACKCESFVLGQTFTCVRNNVLLSRLPAILSIVPFGVSQQLARHCHGDGALPYMADASS